MAPLLYFAYGSNMRTLRLRHRVSDAVVVGPAVLSDHEPRFRKRSIDGSSKCDVVAIAGSVVHGIVFQIPRSQKALLDRAEGLGDGYHEVDCVVTTYAGETQHPFMYVADADAIDELLLPYAWYVRIVVSGATEHGLPKDYIARIKATPCREDPDARRSQRELLRAGLDA